MLCIMCGLEGNRYGRSGNLQRAEARIDCLEVRLWTVKNHIDTIAERALTVATFCSTKVSQIDNAAQVSRTHHEEDYRHKVGSEYGGEVEYSCCDSSVT